MPALFKPDSSLVFDLVASPNHGERAAGRKPDMILLHYTGMPDAQEALLRLCSEGSGVSCHYIVMEDGRVIQCVPESRRAWHAGESYWAGETDINSCSIGIEIANPGHDNGYPDFSKKQIAAVIALCRGIVIRHNIHPQRVLAHSDVAPSRKMDPGEKFPWEELHRARVGHWVRPVPIMPGPDFTLGDRGEIIQLFQKQLAAYGYFVPVNGAFDVATQDAVMAFQRHFRSSQVDGVMDSSTMMTLNALIQSVPAYTPPAPPTVPEIAAPRAAKPARAEEPAEIPPPPDPVAFAAKLAAELAQEFRLKDVEDLPELEPETDIPPAPAAAAAPPEKPAVPPAVAADLDTVREVEAFIRMHIREARTETETVTAEDIEIVEAADEEPASASPAAAEQAETPLAAPEQAAAPRSKAPEESWPEPEDEVDPADVMVFEPKRKPKPTKS
ncbi:MAG: N-acetylmuramoyl-L-alanine amidase [Pseudorhodoplanes sp.]|nr:N-acetylmuramoyl-L-alanine amidase [Pseudorhodoplanes sp.]